MIDLKFDNVSKRYRVDSPVSSQAGFPLVRALKKLRRGGDDFWALRNVSFDVSRGEALGIIGHNGAGKSTILKLLSNITTPSAGEITINGRLAALIEVGSGFHPELTGRENIYLNGSILGMTRREINEKLESIVDFAGVRNFIDTPVKRFSSGMYVRLGFSIAAHLDPDILLLDEVLAVGDTAFQAKCIQRILELKSAGKTIVFISHDLAAVERLCDRVILMERGMIAANGDTHQVITDYQNSVSGGGSPAITQEGNASLSKEAEITSVVFLDDHNQKTNKFQTGRPLTLKIDYVVTKDVPDAVFEVFFYSLDEHLHCQFTTEFGRENINLIGGTTGTLEFSSPELGLVPDIYYIDLTIKHRGVLAGVDIDWKHHYAKIRVDPGKIVRGDFYTSHEWKIDQGVEISSIMSGYLVPQPAPLSK